MKKHHIKVIVFAFALILQGATPFFARDAAKQLDFMSITHENDALAGTDKLYTAGTEISFVYKPWMKPDNDRILYRNTATLGQLVFTPQDIKQSDPIENDRPYAGWSYLSVARDAVGASRLDSWKFTFGLVGPDSYASDIQRSVHQFLGSASPNGWKHQLKNEVGINLHRSRSRSVFRAQLSNDKSIEVIEKGSLALGNVDTSVSKGIRLNFGKNAWGSHSIGRVGGRPHLQPTLSRYSNYPDVPQPKRFYWVLGVNASYVFHNLFLDGNTRKPSQSVKKERIVYEAETGLVYAKSNFQVSALYIHRSKEFVKQNSSHGFASISLSFKR